MPVIITLLIRVAKAKYVNQINELANNMYRVYVVAAKQNRRYFPICSRRLYGCSNSIICGMFALAISLCRILVRFLIIITRQGGDGATTSLSTDLIDNLLK